MTTRVGLDAAVSSCNCAGRRGGGCAFIPTLRPFRLSTRNLVFVGGGDGGGDFPVEVVGQREIVEIARKVFETIRGRPRWEDSLVSLFPPPSSHLLFHPLCVSEVLTLTSANPLISLRFFLWLSAHDSFSPDTATSTALFDSLVRARAWKAALSAIRSTKCRPEPSSLESFLQRLCRNREALEDAIEGISEIKRLLDFTPSLWTWNTALSTSLRIGRTDLIWRFYEKMMEYGTKGDESTARFLVQALSKENKLHEACGLLRHLGKDGVVLDVASFNRLVGGFCKEENYGKVSELLHLMIALRCPPNIFTYQEIIHGLCENGLGSEAFRIFNEIKRKGYAPGVITYTTMIDGLCKMNCTGGAWQLWQEMSLKGIEPNAYTYNVFVDHYCKMGRVDEAKKMYEEMLTRGHRECTVSCNTMIAGLCLQGGMKEAMDILEEMQDKGIDRDVVTYNTLIRGFCNEGRTTEAMNLHHELLKVGLQPTCSSYTPLIRAHCEGNIDEAKELLNDMMSKGLEPLAFIHDYVIIGLVKVGNKDEAMGWLVQMLENNLKPREETFDRLVECLTSAGRVDDALLVVDAMVRVGYSLGSTICSLLVDQLCRPNSHQAGECLMEVLAST